VKGVDQRIDGDQAVFFREIGEVGISGRGRRAGMPENCLDVAEA